MSIPAALRASSVLGRRIGPRHLQDLNLPHDIVATTSDAEPPQLLRASPSASASASASAPQPPRHSYQGPKKWRKKRLVPRLCPFNAHRATPYKLVKTYTGKLSRGSPMLVRNLPGFLDGQAWIDHTTDREGEFKIPRRRGKDEPGFDVLKAILASAVTGRNPKDPTLASESPNLRAVFDDLKAECKMTQSAFEGDDPPLLKFRDWLQQSDFRDYALDEVIAELRETYRADPRPWTPFKAPLVFIRAVHQYNCDQKKTANSAAQTEEASGREQAHPACITGLNGLVVLEDAMTDEFPFPRIIRDIGQTTYKTKSCSIRVGVRPLRSDMRRYKQSTVVVGQLAGYSVVTLIPPSVKALDGLSLEFHKRVPDVWERSTKRYPLGQPNFGLSGKTWTREFEDELSASGDILLATLIPGDGLLVPGGWWYGVRSINNGMQLHATVTWFLGGDDTVIGDQAEYDRATYLKRFPPWVEI